MPINLTLRWGNRNYKFDCTNAGSRPLYQNLMGVNSSLVMSNDFNISNDCPLNNLQSYQKES